MRGRIAVHGIREIEVNSFIILLDYTTKCTKIKCFLSRGNFCSVWTLEIRLIVKSLKLFLQIGLSNPVFYMIFQRANESVEKC